MTKVKVLIPVGFIILVFIACLMAMQNAQEFGIKVDSFIQRAASAAEERNAVKMANNVYDQYVNQPSLAVIAAAPLLKDGNQKQEVSDSKRLVTITSFGDADGCHYTVDFPKLGIPSLTHNHYLTPLEEGGTMGSSDCNHKGITSLGREVVKHLRKHMSWLGKSYGVKAYVFALLIDSLEEILGHEGVLWGVQYFEFLSNLK